MKIGKMGINVYFVAALAFIFAILGWTTAGVLLVGYVVVVEKDNWLTKQTIAALVVQLVSSAVSVVLKGLITTINLFPSKSNSYDYSSFDLEGLLNYGSSSATASSVLLNIITWTGNIVTLVLFVFLVIGFFNVIKGKDAGIPVVGDVANWAFGIVRPRPVYQPPQQPQQYQPQQQPQPQQYQSQQPQPFGNVPPQNVNNQVPPTNNVPPQNNVNNLPPQ